jgi:hypothetical protein
MEDWDRAAAYEALARANAVAGDRDEAGRYLDLARADAAAIANPDDRKHIEADLGSISAPSR